MIGKVHCRGIAREVALAHIGQRPHHDVPAIVGNELRRHGLELAAKEQVQKKRYHDVVAMVPERDLGRADLPRHPIERATAQPRAQRTHRLAFRNQALDDAVGILLHDVKGHAARRQIPRQYVCRKAWLLLIEIDGDEIKGKRRPALEREQDVEQAVAVLAPRQTHHHSIAGLDQGEVGDGLAHQTPQALLELVGLEVRAPGIARDAGAADYDG